MNSILFAFLLTLLAGISTSIGGLIGISMKRDNSNFLSFSLGFSAGIMIYVSFVEIFQKALGSLTLAFGDKMGHLYTILGFFGGMILIAVIDHLIPKDKNPHEYPEKGVPHGDKLKRMGLMTALAVTIHNFPEGMATFLTALYDPSIAFTIFVAIALHNIPEGLAIAAPIYHATGDRKKAFFYATLSGLAEPVGAIIGFLVLRPFLTESFYGIIFAAVAGIMVYISLDELLPTAREFGKSHLAMSGMVLGMVVMALSLFLMI